MKNIRAKSVCVFRHQHKVLLTECFDPAKNQHYLMPIGGGVDFGEKSSDAAIREVREEINCLPEFSDHPLAAYDRRVTAKRNGIFAIGRPVPQQVELSRLLADQHRVRWQKVLGKSSRQARTG